MITKNHQNRLNSSVTFTIALEGASGSVSGQHARAILGVD